MLLLERNVETGAHPWDADHQALDPHDPADNKNCALAMIAMVSAFYGGGLSQDRIGYEVISHRAGNPPGPEGDLITVTGSRRGGVGSLQVGARRRHRAGPHDVRGHVEHRGP